MKPDIYSDNPPKDDLDYKIAVMQAAKEGKPVQYRITGYATQWQVSNTTIDFCWGICTYRIDPASRPKKFVPWSPGETPMPGVGLFRISNLDEDTTKPILLCTEKYYNGLHIGHSVYPLQFCFNNFQYSSDGGKTWGPCGTEVSE